MMKMLSAKKGFTLVEILIVITIVGLLATISIGGYTSFRKSSVLDLAADGLVANIYDARDSAKFGRVMGGGEAEDVDENSSSMCFGVKFSVGEDGAGAGADTDVGVDVTNVMGEFNNTKKWNGGRWVYEGCEGVGAGTSVSLGEGIKVESVNGVAGGTCIVLFAPPNGDVDVDASQCSGMTVEEDGTGNVAKIIIGYGDENTDLQREISINLNTGKAEINKITDESEAQ